MHPSSAVVLPVLEHLAGVGPYPSYFLRVFDEQAARHRATLGPENASFLVQRWLEFGEVLCMHDDLSITLTDGAHAAS